MKTIVPLLATVLLLSPAAPGEILEEGAGIVYGQDHAFNLRAPKGWMLDNESAAGQRLFAVFYPKGSTWKDSVVIAYARSRPKTAQIATADDAAKDVVRDFHEKGSPKYAGKRLKTIKTDTGKEAVIYYFTGDEWGNSEAVAYFVEEKTINFIVMNSRDPKVFTESLPAFEALVKSYIFMGDSPFGEEKEPKNPGPKKKKAS